MFFTAVTNIVTICIIGVVLVWSWAAFISEAGHKGREGLE